MTCTCGYTIASGRKTEYVLGQRRLTPKFMSTEQLVKLRANFIKEWQRKKRMCQRTVTTLLLPHYTLTLWNRIEDKAIIFLASYFPYGAKYKLKYMDDFSIHHFHKMDWQSMETSSIGKLKFFWDRLDYTAWDLGYTCRTNEFLHIFPVTCVHIRYYFFFFSTYTWKKKLLDF